MIYLTNYFTDFADQAILLPIALLLAPCLLVAGWKRAAIAWLGCFLVAYGLVAVLKLVLAGCGHPPLTSPSGHTMAGTLVYGGITLLFFRRPLITLPLCFLLTIVIAWSRLVLHAHTLPEVIVGGLIGQIALWTLNFSIDAPPEDWRRKRFILLAPLLIIPFRHGERSPAEGFIHRIGRLYLGPWLGCHQL